jgi:hypothetical protein
LILDQHAVVGDEDDAVDRLQAVQDDVRGSGSSAWRFDRHISRQQGAIFVSGCHALYFPRKQDDMTSPSPAEILAMSIAQLEARLKTSFLDVREREMITNALMLKKLDRIRDPHWTLTPAFWVAVVAAVAACIAAYPVLFPSQTPQSARPVPPVPAASGASQKQSRNSESRQKDTGKK